ncbi:phosphoribosyltransferase [Candidatus Woesearchaeota archaeon]|nr:phosphoribosyltransferase [Candidatus Woesearchaeota archaeon]
MESVNKVHLYMLERRNGDTKKFKIIHPFDGRVDPLQPQFLQDVGRQLATKLNTTKIDYIVGFAEGGLLPAYGVSQATNIPMIGSYRVRLKHENEITFIEPHSERANHYIYGLKKNDNIIIVEDEITTGSTLVNAITEFERLGVNVIDIGTYIVASTKESAKNINTLAKKGYSIKYLYDENDFN